MNRSRQSPHPICACVVLHYQQREQGQNQHNTPESKKNKIKPNMTHMKKRKKNKVKINITPLKERKTWSKPTEHS